MALQWLLFFKGFDFAKRCLSLKTVANIFNAEHGRTHLHVLVYRIRGHVDRNISYLETATITKICHVTKCALYTIERELPESKFKILTYIYYRCGNVIAP